MDHLLNKYLLGFYTTMYQLQRCKLVGEEIYASNRKEKTEY
jgi:hypothetical protein